MDRYTSGYASVPFCLEKEREGREGRRDPGERSGVEGREGKGGLAQVLEQPESNQLSFLLGVYLQSKLPRGCSC